MEHGKIANTSHAPYIVWESDVPLHLRGLDTYGDSQKAHQRSK